MQEEETEMEVITEEDVEANNKTKKQEKSRES